MLMTANRMARTRSDEQPLQAARYQPPPVVHATWLKDTLHQTGRAPLGPRQFEFFRQGNEGQTEDVELFYAGDIGLLSRRCVSIVGTREASHDGIVRASRLAAELVRAGFVVMSGLARGIDGAAHRSAIEHGGRTAAVIGTPLTKASPAENAKLQEEIWRRHLLISPFRAGTAVFRSNFPQRNRAMAALSDATVIIEAADTSGTLHQASECQNLGRWLFITRAVVDDPSVTWPARFLKGDKSGKTAILDRPEQVISVLAGQ
jgi:DNA processing protein